MTKKLYEINSKLFAITANIVAMGQKEIRLLNEKNQPYQKACGYIEIDQTIFHPQGGGQPADRGNINGIEILHVALEKTENAERILHFFDCEKYPILEKCSKGDCVTVNIDSEFRNKCSRYHSAGHLLADLVEQSYQVRATKGNHFPGQASVLFAFDNTADFLFNTLKDEKQKENIKQDLQKKFNVKAQQGKPVPIFFADKEADKLRKIAVGAKTMPCGGTHVENTTELSGTQLLEISVEKNPPGFKIKYSC